MKHVYLIAFVFLALELTAQQQETPSLFEDINTFLINNVDRGRINYNALTFNDRNLSSIVQRIGAMDLEGKSDNFKLAFYINAYNLLVIKQVLDRYPIQSPMDVPGFFKENIFLVAGEQLTLDQLEFEKIVGPSKDPRIHFALGCAAKSCPFLYDNAFTPEHIQEQLEFRAQLIIDRPNYVSVNKREGVVTMNKIFQWYEGQFVENAGSLIAFINKYRFYKVPKNYKVQFEEYDWTLNRLE